MSKVFIFSTRHSFLHYPNDDDYKKGTGKHLFSEDNCDNSTFDTSSLFEATDEKILRWWFEKLNNKQKEEYKTKFIECLIVPSEYEEDRQALGNQIWQDWVTDGEKTLEEKIEGFEQKEVLIELAKSAYIEANQQNQKYCKIKDKKIYAVKPLDYSKKRKEWIESLLKINESANDIFLLLHDRDIYTSSKPFKVLEQEEIDEIAENITNKNLNILVYQHEKNPVTDILCSENSQDIEDKIESVFYKKKYFNDINKYYDTIFEGDECKKPECKEKFKLSDKEKEVTSYKDIPTNIKQLINEYLTETNDQYITKEKGKEVRVKILKQANYQNPLETNERKGASGFYQEFYENLKDNDEKRIELIPTIYISLFDFLDDKEENKDNKINPLKILTPYLPHYKNIIDSSIWNYYVPYYKVIPNFENITKEDKQKFEDDFLRRLNEAVDAINKNHEKRLYPLPKTREYTNLMYRLLKESYLEDNGHSAFVSPFLFTSESEMKEAADEVLKKIDKKLSWRFLLVDDESYLSENEIKDSELTNKETVLDKPNIAIKKSKCQIIKGVLGENFNFECKCDKENQKRCKLAKKFPIPQNSNNISIEMVCVKSNDLALEKLQSDEKYDIVLMDYLLGYKPKTTEREYSTEILEIVKDKDKITQGIYGKFWFFYISAYNVAVHEMLLEKQFLHVTEFWQIEEGACPINTPQLFRYLLFSFMKRQIDVITRPQEKIKDENGITVKIVTLIDLLNHIFEGTNKVRSRAIKNFNNLLKLRLTYDKIKYDVCLKEDKTTQRKDDNNEKSALIKSLFADVGNYDNAFWEHTMHLVYLTAFGTIRQWHDMWEEFMLIKPYLQKAYDEKKKDNSGNVMKDENGNEISLNPKAKDVISRIEDYITELQKQSR